MTRRLLLALFGAFVAFFATMGRANADELPKGVAEPGSWASRHGAPLCDVRAASSYAADPAPQPVDSNEIAPATRDSEVCVGESHKLDRGNPLPVDHDQLQSAPPAMRDAALPLALPSPGPAVSVDTLKLSATPDGARDGYDPNDAPPPRPIPWGGR